MIDEPDPANLAPEPDALVADAAYGAAEGRVVGRALGARVAGEHALDADAHALHVMHGRPALRPEQVEADDAVAVDVRVQRDGPRDGVGERDECRFGRACEAPGEGEGR